MVEPVAATPASALVTTEPPDPPPNVKPFAVTPAAAPDADAAFHITTATPSSPTSLPASDMERRRALRSRFLYMHKTDGTSVPPPVSDMLPVTKAHETSQFESKGLKHINGSICDKEWGFKANNDLVLSPSNKEASSVMSRLNLFMSMFLPNHLLNIFQLTNTQLAKVRQKETNRQ